MKKFTGGDVNPTRLKNIRPDGKQNLVKGKPHKSID